tara:strand:- start:859 stop:1134 length:276 start_codon:yes stop_codon:yes gene_type:complete
MSKIDLERFITLLAAQSLRNDGNLSEDELNIINTVKTLGKEDAFEVYLEVLKAAYKDKKITEDESDLIGLARDLLQISHEDHQNALTELAI